MNPFEQTRYELRRKLFSPIHIDLTVFTPDGQAVLYGRKKGFRLKEDIRLYGHEARQRELIAIQARSVLDFSAAYDITDSSGILIGVLRRQGMRSLVRDEWHILDTAEQPIATLQEDSLGLAVLRRFLTSLIPQSFHITSMGGAPLGVVTQHFNPIHLRLSIDFSSDTGCLLDRRLGLAAAALLGTIEKRQN